MKRGFTLLELLVLLILVGIVAAILFPVFARRDRGGHRPSCQSNLKNIGLGFMQYVQDNNEKFPVVASTGIAYGWADELQPYIKSVQVFQCSSEATRAAVSPQDTGYTDYWMNPRLAGRSQSTLNATALTFLNGDGNDGVDITNARYAYGAIAASWKGNKNSPLYRHLEGMNFGFTDGHVKWFAAEKIEAMNPISPTKAGKPTFALK